MYLGMWGYFNQSCLDGLFSKEDFTVEELMEEENIVNDVKMNQSKFADFMIKNPRHLRSLVQYALRLPSENDDVKYQHKFPFIASEILGIQIPKIQEFFFTTRPHQEEPENEKHQEQSEDNTTKAVEVDDKVQVSEDHPQSTNEKVSEDQQVEQVPAAEQVQEEHVEKQPEAIPETKNEDQSTEQLHQNNELKTESESEKKQEPLNEVKQEEVEQTSLNQEQNQEQPAANQTQEPTVSKEEDQQSNKQNEAQEEVVPKNEIQESVSEGENLNQAEQSATTTNQVNNSAEDTQKQEDEDDDEQEDTVHSHNESAQDKHEPAQEVVGEDLLKEVFAFILLREELNSTSAGYFSKIITHLVNAREGNLIQYVIKNPSIVEDLVHHFYLKSISKVVLQLITQDGIDLETDTYLSYRISMINRLHELFAVSNDHEVLLNIQDVLVAINNASFKPQNFDVKRALFSSNNIKILLASITQHKESFSQAALTLSSYLDHYRQTIFNETPSEDNETGYGDYLNFGRNNDEAIDKEFPLPFLQTQTDSLIKALMEENLNVEVPKHETQYGALVQPFGLNRVKLLHLILCLLKTENEGVNNALVDNHFFSYLLGLVAKHEWNNILHNQVEQIFTESFKIAVKNTRVRESIINEANFLSFLVNNGLVLKTSPGTSRKQINKGYVCLIINFANQIEEQKKQFDWLAEAVEKAPQWKEFIEGSCKIVNDLNKKNLGDEDPRKRKESSEISNNDISIKDIYMKFIGMYQQNNKNSQDDEADANDDSEGDEENNASDENKKDQNKDNDENDNLVADIINAEKEAFQDDDDQGAHHTHEQQEKKEENSSSANEVINVQDGNQQESKEEDANQHESASESENKAVQAEEKVEEIFNPEQKEAVQSASGEQVSQVNQDQVKEQVAQESQLTQPEQQQEIAQTIQEVKHENQETAISDLQELNKENAAVENASQPASEASNLQQVEESSNSQADQTASNVQSENTSHPSVEEVSNPPVEEKSAEVLPAEEAEGKEGDKTQN